MCTLAEQHVRGPYAQQPQYQVAVMSLTQLITGFILRFAQLSVCARLLLKPQLFAVSCVWFKLILSDSSVFFECSSSYYSTDGVLFKICEPLERLQVCSQASHCFSCKSSMVFWSEYESTALACRKDLT